MRFGHEQALDDQMSRRSRLKYKYLGDSHAGRLLRFLWLAHDTGPFLEGRNLRILEVGSNTGSFVFWLARRSPGSRVCGLEIDREMASRSARINERLGLANAHFMAGDITTPALKPGFDLVYCIDVLEHIADDDLALANIHGLLAEGGRFILQFPPKIRKQSRWDVEGGHVGLGYTREELLEKIEAAGFHIERVERATGIWGAIGYLIDVTLTLFLRLRFPITLPFIPFILAFVRLDPLLTRKRRFGGFVVTALRGRSDPGVDGTGVKG